MTIRRGFSLVEAAIASAVLAVLVVGALQAMGHAARGRHLLAEAALAASLAEDLATEIAAQAFHDPQTASTDLGPDPGETGATRALYDDVDDYDGLVDSPPRTKAGVQIADASWRRTVDVEFVTFMPQRTLIDVKSPTPKKRVIITVSRRGVPLATRTVVRTRDAHEVLP